MRYRWKKFFEYALPLGRREGRVTAKKGATWDCLLGLAGKVGEKGPIGRDERKEWDKEEKTISTPGFPVEPCIYSEPGKRGIGVCGQVFDPTKKDTKKKKSKGG